MISTIIIGKTSNLSRNLALKLQNAILISSRDLSNDLDVLSGHLDKNINIVFNNFQPSTLLNEPKNYQEYIVNTIQNTAKVLDFIKDKRQNINKIIYTSSSSVYGNNIFCSETDELKPLNLHASLKVANEKLIEKFCLESHIDYTIARIFNMYGGEDKFSVISKIIKAYENNQEFTTINSGNAVRDFIHIDDVVQVYIKLLEVKNVNAINIGTGEGYSVKNILDFLKNNYKALKTKNLQKEELKVSTANIQLLTKLFGEKSFVSVEEYLLKVLKK